jgi:hypothetical protein
MKPVFALLGLVCLGLALSDMFKTVLTLRGGGPLTAFSSRWIWRGFQQLHRRWPERDFLGAAGPAILSITMLGWVVLQWAGWSLLFMVPDRGIVRAHDGASASAFERFYYAGSSLVTLGLGDFQAEGQLWQFLSIVDAALGLLTVSLGAAYFIPVLSAAVTRRELALAIEALGGTPEGILRQGWTGADFGRLEHDLLNLGPAIITMGQQHLIYPVLHYFHSATKETSLSLQLVALDEVLHLLAHAVAPDHRPSPSALRLPAKGISAYFEFLEGSYLRASPEVPPTPKLEWLQTTGVPVVSDDQYVAALAKLNDRRQLARALVEDSGWAWDDVTRPRTP